jgi:hypothetical protein
MHSGSGVQHCLRFCLDDLNCVKMAAFQLYLQLEKQRKVGWVVVLFLVKHSLCDKRSVKWYVVMMKQPVLFVAIVLGEVFAHFHAIVIKHHSSMRN